MTRSVVRECSDGLRRIALSHGLRAYDSGRRSLTPEEFKADGAHIGRPPSARLNLNLDKGTDS